MENGLSVSAGSPAKTKQTVHAPDFPTTVLVPESSSSVQSIPSSSVIPGSINSSDILKSCITVKNAVIKGYHVYQIKPPETEPKTRLIIDREYTNMKDKDACLVWIPELTNFDEHYHYMVTDDKRQSMLSDVAGLPIGHVPKVLASCFFKILGYDGKIYAEATGNPVPSFPPWPAPSEPGGGVVIPCNYLVFVPEKDRSQTLSMLKETLNDMEEGSSMEIEC